MFLGFWFGLRSQIERKWSLKYWSCFTVSSLEPSEAKGFGVDGVKKQIRHQKISQRLKRKVPSARRMYAI
jgi:hypothetical protein